MSQEFHLFDNPAPLLGASGEIRLLSIELYGGLFQHDFHADPALFRYLEEKTRVSEFAEDREQSQSILLEQMPDTPWGFRHDRIYQSLRAAPEIELGLLSASLTPTPHALALLDHALRNGITVVAACDGALPESFWRALLAKHAIVTIKHVYTSNDLLVSKRKYTMFRRILADFELAPKQVIHFGPDDYNDVGVPRDIGMSYARLQSPRESLMHRFPSFASACAVLEHRPSTGAALINKAMENTLLFLASRMAPSDFTDETVSSLLRSGPLLLSFCDWISQWLTYLKARHLVIAAPETSVFARIGAVLLRRALPNLEVWVIPPARVDDFNMQLRDMDSEGVVIVNTDADGAGTGKLIARNPHLAIQPALYFSLVNSDRSSTRSQCFMHRDGRPKERARVESEAAPLIDRLFSDVSPEDTREFEAFARLTLEWSRLLAKLGVTSIPRSLAVALLDASNHGGPT